MAYVEQWNAFEEQLADISATRYVTRLVVQDLEQNTLNSGGRTVLRNALSQSPHITGPMAVIEHDEGLGPAIAVTAIVDGFSQADALTTVTAGLTEGLHTLVPDPESFELKGVFIAPERAIPFALEDAEIVTSDFVENFPVNTLIAPNPAGDVLVEMDAGEVYYMARAQYLQ